MAVTVDTNAKLLVTGASGQLGQLTVKHLLDTLKVSPANIVAGSRNPGKLKEFADRGVKTVRFDFNDTASIQEAAKGIDRALLISGTDPDRLNGHKLAVDAFIAAGVKHVLYTSVHNVEKRTGFAGRDHAATEAYIRESKIQSYSLLRNGLYFEKDFMSVPGAKQTGKWYSAAKDGKLAGISRDDLALAGAAALASNSYANHVFELSGTVGLTIDEVVANFSAALGTPIEVVQVSVEDLGQRIAAATGLPEVVAAIIASFDTAQAEGASGPLANDFKTLVGRDPVPHREWVEAVKPILQAM